MILNLYRYIDGVLAIERFMKAFMSIPEEALDAYVARPSCSKLYKINLSSMVDKKQIIHCNEYKNFFLVYYLF